MQFDFISKYYDALSKLVFGNVVYNAQTSLFDKIEDGKKILFVGGGTGFSLLTLLNRRPYLTIDFIDSSHKMISMAKARVNNNSNVAFHHMKIQQFVGTSYDYIITEFFFDLFNKREVIDLINLLAKKLNSHGVWLDTDFRMPTNFKNRFLLRGMYMFFHIVASVKSNRLVDTKPVFLKQRLIIKEEINFNDNFISSRLIGQI